MSNPYITNSDIYQVNAERDIAVILSRFNTNFIYDCIDNALESRNNTLFIIPSPNLVRSIEDNFIFMQENYPDDKDNILACREETYEEIISYLCEKFNLEFNPYDQIVDLYSAAFHIYEFLVNKYLFNLSNFFINFIMKEKNSLYKSLNLDRFKKITNINYGKKMVKDQILSSIIINLPYVLDQLSVFDFDFESIVRISYSGNNISNFIISLFKDNGYFYNFYKTDINNSFIRPDIITNIRLHLQPNAIDDNVLNTIPTEE